MLVVMTVPLGAGMEQVAVGSFFAGMELSMHRLTVIAEISGFDS